MKTPQGLQNILTLLEQAPNWFPEPEIHVFSIRQSSLAFSSNARYMQIYMSVNGHYETCFEDYEQEPYQPYEKHYTLSEPFPQEMIDFMKERKEC